MLKQQKMDTKFNPENLELDMYNYNNWYEKEELADTTAKGDK